MTGYVLDRSVDGVRLALQASFPTGSNLQIRAANAPAETPWATITVTNSKELPDYFQLGCQFEEKLPWNVLLMFG